MIEWTNPYSEFQHALREALYERLRRTNGCIDRDQFMVCVEPGHVAKAEKMLLRLLNELPDGRLEWKPDIVTEKILLQKLGGSTALRSGDLVTLWSQSRKVSSRTAFPHIAPAGKKSQHVSRHSFGPPPVFGVDILVRPPTTFSEDRDDRSLRNELKLGDECLALAIHGTLDNGRLLEDGEYFVRLVLGNAFAIPKITSTISPASGRCEQVMRAPLQAGDVRRTVDAALPHLNDFARAAALAFIN